MINHRGLALKPLIAFIKKENGIITFMTFVLSALIVDGVEVLLQTICF